MTANEIRIQELLGRTRKAARIALAIARHYPLFVNESPRTIRQALALETLREAVQTRCGYGHVSDDTWELVAQMLEDAR